MARRRSRACCLLSRRTKSGVSSLVLSSLPPCHTHTTSWLTDTHTIPFRGRVYVCVAINTVSPSHPSMKALSRLRQCPQTNHPRLLQPIIANARPTPGCVQGLSFRIHSMRSDDTCHPCHAHAVRCIAFRFVFRFRFYFGFIFRFSFRFRFILSASVSER